MANSLFTYTLMGALIIDEPQCLRRWSVSRKRRSGGFLECLVDAARDRLAAFASNLLSER